jgi:Domain of unknown function (DUF802)
MNRNLGVLAFVIGLAAVGWVASGYVQSSPLALAMTLLIGTFYVLGALELRRFDQATSALGSALAAIPGSLPNLGDWLAQVPASLRNAVRLRIEGERAGLPGPAMTPYLVGLLVLLGMLGTFLGMVVTLNGAVLALESTTDLPTIRAALAAPVKGLGLAFGTSVAGVAASAMLGLVSALCRRERLQTAQLLDTQIATTLRAFSLAHQRQETLDTLQRQARALPEVADTLQALMAQIERRAEDLNQRLAAGQDGFHRQAQAAYTDLASSVGRALEQSLAEGARLAGAAVQPVVESTMSGIAREAAQLHQKTADTVSQQLEDLSSRFAGTAATLREEQAAALTALARESVALHESLAATVAAQFNGLAARFSVGASSAADTWKDTLASHQRGSESMAAELQTSLAAMAQTFDRQSAQLLVSVEQSHGVLQARLAAEDQQRLAAFTLSLASMAQTLRHEWQQSGAQTLSQQEQICRTLEQTARDITAQAQSGASATIAELSRLAEAASEAPRAAAEVMTAMRHTLSSSLARDNDLIEERSRLMATLSTLLDTVHHSANEQRAAIDSLVVSSAAALQQASVQFTGAVEAESGKLVASAAHVTGSAVEVASMGEAFGLAVHRFGDSNEALMTHLQRLEAALNKSTARSDEQLAYYVAQAREVIDLSLLSQKQIIEELRQLPARQAAAAGEVA